MEDIAKALADNRLVVFAGSGICRDAGLPDWRGLAQGVRDSFNEQGWLGQRALPYIDELIAKGSLIRALDTLQAEAGTQGRARLAKVIRDLLGSQRGEGQACQALAQLRVSGVVTTNYDRLTETVVPSEPPPYRLRNSLIDLRAVATAASSRTAFLLKLHGDIDDSAAPHERLVAEGGPFMVVIDSDYAALMQGERRTFLLNALHSILQDYSCLFLGYSFGDPDISLFLRHLAAYNRFGHPSWYVLRKGDTAPELPDNVEPLQSINDWDELPGWLERVKERRDALSRQLQSGSARRSASWSSPPSEEEQRAIGALIRYLSDLETDNIADRVLACALLDHIAQRDEIDVEEVKERVRSLLDVGPEWADAFAQAAMGFLGALKLVTSEDDRVYYVAHQPLRRLMQLAEREWQEHREHFMSALKERVGANRVRLDQGFYDAFDRILQDLCMTFGEAMARWVYKGVGPDPESLRLDSTIRTYLINAEPARIAEQALRGIMEHPRNAEVPYLYRLLSAPFLANSVRLDPSTTDTLRTTLSAYELYLDSNVLLPLLIEEHRDHQAMLDMLTQSQKCGVQFFVLQPIFDEVLAHRRIADEEVGIKEDTSEAILLGVEMMGSRANCFEQGFLAARYENDTLRWREYIARYSDAQLRQRMRDHGVELVTCHKDDRRTDEYRAVLNHIRHEWQQRRRGQNRPDVLNENEALQFMHIYHMREDKGPGSVQQIWFLSYETVLEQVFQIAPATWTLPPTFPVSAWTLFLDSQMASRHSNRNRRAVVNGVLRGLSVGFGLPDDTELVRRMAFGNRVTTSEEEEALRYSMSDFPLVTRTQKAFHALKRRGDPEASLPAAEAKAYRAELDEAYHAVQGHTNAIGDRLGKNIDELQRELNETRRQLAWTSRKLEEKQGEPEQDRDKFSEDKRTPQDQPPGKGPPFRKKRNRKRKK